MSNRAFLAFISLVLVLGLYAGYHLSTLPKLETFRLINIAGLFYDLLGVLVLSEIVGSNETWKKISVDWIAPAVLWLHTVFPLGALFGGLLAAGLVRNSSGVAVSTFALTFWGYSMIPLLFLNETVVFPQFALLKGLETRWRWFGLFLLMTGVALQLIAALMGLGVASS